MSAGPSHSNLYTRGFPPGFSEAELLAVFAEYGTILSLRMVSATEGQAPHAFVKLETPAQAAGAIQGLNGATVGGSQLVVKFADADVQPRVESGRQPSEWCYCRNLPATYTRQDVGEMFVPFGTVLEIRLFPSTELYKGSGALVQMQSMEQAAGAIQALNGSFPRGATQPLLVRYADSPAEKAAKQARKERLLHKQVASSGLFSGNSLLAAQLHQQLLGLAITNGGNGMAGRLGPAGAGPNATSMTNSPELSSDLPSVLSTLDGYQDSTGSAGPLPTAAMLQQQAAAAAVMAGQGGGAAGQAPPPGGGASIYIKGMPEDADKLWLYEKFARFGGIASVRVLIDEQTGKCNGIGFVNYVAAEAARLAQESMNGVSMGDRLLHVMVQNPAARARAAGPPLAGGNGMGGGMQGAVGQQLGGGNNGGLPSASAAARNHAAMMQAANQLGISATTLASLQAASAAGLVTPASNSMQLQGQPMGLPLPDGGAGQQGFGNNLMMPGPGYGSLQW